MQGRDNDLHRDRWRQRHCAGERKVPGWWTTRLSWPASEHGKSEAHPGSDFWNSLQVRVDRTKRAYRKGSMVNIPSGYDIRHCRLLSGSVGSRGCISPRTPSFLSPFLSEHLLPHFGSHQRHQLTIARSQNTSSSYHLRWSSSIAHTGFISVKESLATIALA